MSPTAVHRLNQERGVIYYVYTTEVGQTMLNRTLLACCTNHAGLVWPSSLQLSFITVYTVKQTGLTRALSAALVAHSFLGEYEQN